jgi:hypothetical protein
MTRITKVIADNQLYDWFVDYPWLTGSIGDPKSPVWFIGENPSLSAVQAIDRRSSEKNQNLQWNSSSGDRLFREALAEAGLKSSPPGSPGGWKCFITNAIKEPEIVRERNEKKRDRNYWENQAERWLGVLQDQISSGAPKVLVALGGQTERILKHMEGLGLVGPAVERIHHYSYIMRRPEAASGRGPGHPDRVVEFKASVRELVDRYGANKQVR